MPSCSNLPNSKIVAQTIFLGASVSSFSSSMGWGGQPSQLTVNLVADEAGSACQTAAQFSAASQADNHYHTCTGDGCYVDRDGTSWNDNLVGTRRADGSMIEIGDKMVPGKVYYNFTTNSPDPVVSKYWIYPDPGFLGAPNRISTAGTASNVLAPTNTGYDIIGTPVYFKMGNFSFGGIVQSWQEDFGSGGKQYRVTIDGMQSVLSNAYIIISEYGGAIFSKFNSSSTYGSPRNYVGSGPIYSGKISEGNIANVFNVYGFLESSAPENFGGADCNDEGMSAISIIDALSVLTSCMNSGSRLNVAASSAANLGFGPKTAYSPYGRILVKCAQTYDYTPITSGFTSWGVIPPQTNLEDSASTKCEFLLDLSELPKPPQDFRIKGIKISILEFINLVTEACGYDYSIELIPVYSGRMYNVIKLKTISRLKQPVANEIQSTVNQLICNNYPVTSSTIGKEKNESPARMMIVGGPIQRLYQAKSYRLAYTQHNYILTPYGKFIDYVKLGHYALTAEDPPPGGSITSVPGSAQNFGYGKIKFPAFGSVRNPTLSSAINGTDFADLFADDESIKNVITQTTFTTADSDWNDTEQVGSGAADVIVGNYPKSTISKYTAASWGGTTRTRENVTVNNTRKGKGNAPFKFRYIPLWRDIICPFYGYVMDSTLTVDTNNQSQSARDFRRVRPVFYDSWTGQICILFRASELPLTRVDLRGLYGGYTLSSRQSRLFSWNEQPDAEGDVQPPVASTDTKEYFFLITESEIRAAMAGPDSFLAYSVSRKYKTDLYVMMNQAYFSKEYSILTALGAPALDAARIAKERCDWSWKFDPANAANPAGGPSPVLPSTATGPDPNIREEVRQDFALLSSFIGKLGESYYGKKYMVYAPFLGARKQESYGSSLATSVGTAYVFRGDSNLTYNYVPTNDGGWEEPGNIIDDTIAVGGKDALALSDENGLIKPILGYNVTDNIDYVKYNICQNMPAMTPEEYSASGINPYFNYPNWQEVRYAKSNTNCQEQDFIFPSIDISTLQDASTYIVKQLSVNAYNSLGEALTIPKKKLYIQSSVQEKIIFLNPEQLAEPRIIISPPGPIFLNNVSLVYQKDPSRTVKALTAMEDLAVYLRSNDTSVWDINLIRFFTEQMVTLYTSYGLLGDSTYNPSLHKTNTGNYEVKAKATSPFYAGIPIRSNQYNYGPWINYPTLELNTDTIFPDGNNTSLSFDATTGATSCSSSSVTVSTDTAKKAIDNWILPTDIEYKPEFVPWSYGGMSYLDNVAYKELKTRINYQSVIETATVEMPGLPIFNIGGSFNPTSLNNKLPITAVSSRSIKYKEYKRNSYYSTIRPLGSFTDLGVNDDRTYTNGTLTYNVIKLPYILAYLNGPIISHISVDVSRSGIKSTYHFRTYTRKLALFNKEYSDRFKKIAKENLLRDKQIAKLTQQLVNKTTEQNRNILSQDRPGSIGVGTLTGGSSSTLVGKSPVEIITAAAFPVLKEPVRSSEYIDRDNSQSQPTESSTATYSLLTSDDLGAGDLANGLFDDETYQIASLKHRSRSQTTTKIFQVSEIGDFLRSGYGTKAAMGLDGLFSPVSFYPTDSYSTFSFSKYISSTCPVCNNTRKRQVQYKKYNSGSVSESKGTYTVVCECCTVLGNKVHSQVYNNTSFKNYSEALPPYILTDQSDTTALTKMDTLKLANPRGSTAAINLISLQPIVVPYDEFRNPNVQNYTGDHPEKAHDTLKINDVDRSFVDRCRHSISIVGRSAVDTKNLEIQDGIDNKDILIEYDGKKYNPDFFYKDLHGIQKIKAIDSSNYSSTDVEMNHRFVGFRGPIVMHGWGYDKEGYPVPNAADEPIDIDGFGRPKRFSVSRIEKQSTTYKKLAVGQVFLYNGKEYVKAKSLNMQNTPGYHPEGDDLTEDSSVTPVIYEDDMTSAGGFDPDAYQGSVIGKTQVYQNGMWSRKKKLNEFYLNWAEHPETWPVGPIDLRWDESRRVWTANQDPVYKMVYVTLEEDLVKAEDLDETYPSRGFLDDLEYSTMPLNNSSYRRVVFVKDRSGYTAPRGAKLLCRYDIDTGFYEPVSKPVFVVMGIIGSGGGATITMSYVLGRKKGENAPSMEVSFDNPLNFNTGIDGSTGMFTYVSGKWILTAINK